LPPRFGEQRSPVIQIDACIRVTPKPFDNPVILLPELRPNRTRKLGRVQSLPAQRVDRQRARYIRSPFVQVQRINAPASKSFNKRDAISETVVTDEIKIGSDQPAQVLEESNVHRRQIIDGSYAHCENVIRRLRCLLAQPVHKIRMDRSAWQHSGSTGVDSDKISDPRIVNRYERIEYRRNEHGAPRVRSQSLLQIGGVGFEPLPFFALHTSDGIAQSAPPARRVAELHGKTSKSRFCLDVAAGAADLALQHLLDCEVLHQ